MATTLGLDFIMSVSADSSTVSREAREAMGITFQEEQAALKTPVITISRGNTLELTGSSEGLSLPLYAPSFEGDSNSRFEEV